MDSSQFDEGDGFAALGLRNELLDTLTELGYEEPTPVQRETIPHLIEGRDLVGQAATGTGQDGGVRPAVAAHAGDRPRSPDGLRTRARADSRAGHAGIRGDLQVRP